MIKSSKKNPTNLIPAPIFRRLFAFVYDSFIVFAFLLVATAIALVCTKGKSLLPFRFLFLSYLLITTGLFLSWFWSKSGQTLGMLAWKIRVVDIHHQPLSFSRAFFRFLLSVIGIFLGVGILWCFFDNNKQSLYDRLAGTKIIRC